MGLGRLRRLLHRPTADAATSALMRDVIGHKSDTAVHAPNTTKTILAYMKGAVDLMPRVAKTGSVLLTDGSVADIFTIAGGPILVEALFAEITVVVSGDACAAKLVMDPANGADTDLCTTFDINAIIVNSFLTIDGTIATAMVNAVPATAVPLGIGMDIPMILPVGTIDLNLANSAPSTGTSVWYMRYRPLAIGVTVAAVA